MNKRLLVTGGAGFIGTHTLVELFKEGYTPVVFDNFSNSSVEAVRRVEKLVGAPVELIQGDVRSASDLDAAFQRAEESGIQYSAVIHFAGLKAVGESVAQPLKYYDNNVAGTIALLEAMDRFNVKRIVFSSSATVYGTPSYLPYDESHPIGPSNPYGWTKAISERILEDWANVGEGRVALSLRYFNPIGAHVSGTIGEDPKDKPNNLFPFLTQVAVGKRDVLSIFGKDYDTCDGTGVRDYVHVVDLAVGHVKAIAHSENAVSFHAFNLGTGKGTSVLQLVNTFESATGRSIAHEIQARRPGDLAETVACVKHANKTLGWAAEKDITDMCVDGWRWQSANPSGYEPS